MRDVLVCADLGTTRIKAAAIDQGGGMVATSARQTPPFLDWAGFLAFDSEACLAALFEAIGDVVQTVGDTPVQGILLTNQRATVIALDDGGKPLGPALSWQDTSSAAHMAAFCEDLGEGRFSRITGLPESVFLSLPKLLRLRQTEPALFARVGKIVSLHDFALKRLGSKRFTIDLSNASVTGLFDIERLDWSDEILAAAGMERSLLPEIASAGTVCGTLCAEAAGATGMAKGTPILVGGGDQQFSALGTGALEPGDGALCLGTAAVLSVPVAQARPDLADRFFCTAHVIEGQRVVEGIHSTFAGCLEWAGSLLGLATPEQRQSAFSGSEPGARGARFFPFLSGIASPDHDTRSAGTFAGLRHHHRAQDLMRAVYEGILLEARRLVEATATSVRVDRLHVSGGFIKGMRPTFLADILGRDLRVSQNPESTLAGAAAAGWAELMGGDGAEIRERLVRGQHALVPRREDSPYDDMFEAYLGGVDRVREFYGG